MQARAAVARSDALAALGAPGRDDAVDGAWIEVRAVAEDDDSGLDVVPQRAQAAAK
jgi:hypothetical protein